MKKINKAYDSNYQLTFVSDNYFNSFNSRLESTDQPAQWQRSASYENEKLKVKNEKSKCIVIFSPPFCFYWH